MSISGRTRSGRYYRARYYHPSLQRFISEDPIGLEGGPNLYMYVDNNPLSFSDPFGLDIYVTVFDSSQQPFGHVGLGVNTTETVGFYPVEGASIRELLRGRSVPGRVVKDKKMSHLTAAETFRIKASVEQDQCIQSFIDQRTKNPESYRLGGRSCGEFVRDALRECKIIGAGIGGPVTPAGVADRLRLHHKRWP